MRRDYLTSAAAQDALHDMTRTDTPEELSMTITTEPAPPPPARKRPVLIAVASAAAVAVIAMGAYMLGGGGSDPAPQAAAASSTPAASATTGRPAVAQVECVNIDRAHNAWAGLSLPSTAADVAALNEVTVKMAMDDGKDYLNAVEGYESQPSRSLAVAIAEYNFELSVVNVQVTMGSRVDSEDATKVEQAVAAVAEKYQAWRSATCV